MHSSCLLFVDLDTAEVCIHLACLHGQHVLKSSLFAVAEQLSIALLYRAFKA